MNDVRNMKQPIPAGLVALVTVWLGVDGLKFFRETKEKHGEVAAVYDAGGYPHCVHFAEGMALRNFMRGTGLCKDWDACMYDDTWVSVVEACLIEASCPTLVISTDAIIKELELL